ncbi:hypothetical protein BATDEDRAFT_21253 [Batrachochytrium dendrobatidis JAM81]|uniref:Major facilitator superfamily (MFS) profile domain-containing protein n=1 Tax=Batrachochytrium dendrobatidis (strain JAM81 / FGSC 10211) TaxID=684364 RepID=F4NRY7_BATDJ|nr:uncharacterized protein BATDEDRAFT_21253 [Batrachochytrium dendrobatidis JAM81]EGF82978.1 hypothetical protein BATDEDRAFT_21253 [Batrachochytrium dendrobatidis JAM81]|eukprot:XP_006675237.1 hypothetical protein BATDEDRAFT_21253 [Batrachochytrium dendrobatidis JAM81]
MSSPTRWVVLSSLALVLVGNYYIYDIPTALNRQLNAAMGVDKKQWQFSLAQSYSFYTLPNIIMPFVSSILVDRIGSHWALVILSLCTISGSIVFAAGVYMQDMFVFLAGRFILGLAGESLGVAQARLTCRWFGGPELAFALGINLSTARLGSVLNDLLTPTFAMLPTTMYNGILVGEHASTQFAVFIGVFVSFCSTLAAIIAVIIDLYTFQEPIYQYQNIPSYQDSVGGSAIDNTLHPYEDHHNIDCNASFQESNTGNFIEHHASTSNLQPIQHGARPSNLSFASLSVGSSTMSGFIAPQTVVRTWWSPLTDNLAHVQHDTTLNADMHTRTSETANSIRDSIQTSYAEQSQPVQNIRDSLGKSVPTIHYLQSFGSISNATQSADSVSTINPAQARTASLSLVSPRSLAQSSHRRPSQSLIQTMPLVVEEEQRESTQGLSSPDEYLTSAYHTNDNIASDYSMWTEIWYLPLEYWLIVSLMVIYYGSTMALINVLGDELQNILLFPKNSQQAGWMLAIPDLVSTILVPVCGSIIQYRGRRIFILGVCGMLLVIVHAVLVFAKNTMVPAAAIYAICLVVLGIVYAFYICIVWPLIAFVVQDSFQEMSYTLSTSLLNTGLTIIPLLSAQSIITSGSVSDYTQMHYLLMGLSAFGTFVICPLLFWKDQVSNEGIINTTGDAEYVQRVSHRIISESDIYCDYDIYPNYYQQADHPIGYDGRNDEDGLSENCIDRNHQQYNSKMSLSNPQTLDHCSTKLTDTKRWFEYGTMYGTIVDENTGKVVACNSKRSLPIEANGLNPYEQSHCDNLQVYNSAGSKALSDTTYNPYSALIH